MPYVAALNRYATMRYSGCGRSGLKLPAVALGLWHNFGGDDVYENGRAMARRAFDLGITHFDLANNYGPPYGSAEESFGRILAQDLRPYRDELIDLVEGRVGHVARPVRRFGLAQIPGGQPRPEPEADGAGVRRHLLPPPPRSRYAAGRNHGRAGLYRAQRPGAVRGHLGLFGRTDAPQAAQILRALGTPCLIHQPCTACSIARMEDGLLEVLEAEGMGCIVFSPAGAGLAHGQIPARDPDGSRASKGKFLKPEDITEAQLNRIRRLNELAGRRGQTLAQMAVAWVLRHAGVTSAIIGASRPGHIDDAVAALHNTDFSAEELRSIDAILGT